MDFHFAVFSSTSMLQTKSFAIVFTSQPSFLGTLSFGLNLRSSDALVTTVTLLLAIAAAALTGSKSTCNRGRILCREGNQGYVVEECQNRFCRITHGSATGWMATTTSRRSFLMEHNVTCFYSNISSAAHGNADVCLRQCGCVVLCRPPP
jgi:hypothetical protein